MILLSSTYQMDSHAAKEVRDADPANRLWSRFNRVRMSVEQIRDSFLALGGNLDATIGGSLLPQAGARAKGSRSEGSIRTKSRGARCTFRCGAAASRRCWRRSITATPPRPSDGRPRTNVAPQALFMMNSRFVVEQAGGFAKRLLDDAGLSDAQRVERAYLMALTRRPGSGEVDSALDVYRRSGEADRQAGRAREGVAELLPCADVDERVSVFELRSQAKSLCHLVS